MGSSDSNSNWGHLEAFARRFTLAESVAQPETRTLFEPSINFAASVIDMVGELDARWESVTGFDRAHAREQLIRSAQHLLEAVITAMAGMYASSNVIYRLSVEAVFQSTYTDEQILERSGADRRATILANDWDISTADYRRVLCQSNRFKLPAKQLYTVYRSLSKVAHGDLKLFTGLDQHLHSLPRFVAKEASDLRDLMTVGNAAAGVIIRNRFGSLFKAANLERVAAFDEAVRKLKPAPQAPFS